MNKCLFISVMILMLPVISAAQDYEETGTCSFYGNKFQGKRTTSGESYDKNLYTAAHRTLAFNTLVLVTNPKNNKQVVVRINDRGPNIKSRLIDVSFAAAKDLDMVGEGVITVTVKYAGMANADSVRDFLEQRKKETALKNKSTIKKEPVINKELKPESPKEPANDILVSGTFYNHDLKICEPKGYGVQVGYYKGMSSCINAMHAYETRYNTVAYIYVEKSKNSTFYKLFMGQLGNKQSANDLQDLIKKEIPSCFVVAYSSL